MTETKPKDWEEEIYKVGVPHIGFPLDSETDACIKVIDALIPFIRKIRTDAVLEERKRIEEGVEKYSYKELLKRYEVVIIKKVKFDLISLINNKSI